MQIGLEKSKTFAKNRVDFIDGILERLTENSPILMVWQCSDAIIEVRLTTAIEKEILDNVNYACTTREIWKDLEKCFKKESAPRAYENKSLLQQENKSCLCQHIS